MFGLRTRRRRRWRERPLSEAAAALVASRLPQWRFLDADEQARLGGLINAFVHDKHFEGCGGLELAEEMSWIVAAHACLPLLGMEIDVYPSISSVLIYPGEFLAARTVVDETGIVTESFEPLVGEAGELGAVVLSWPDVEEACARTGQGYNVVIHEFAHVLDEEGGGVNGVPRLEDHGEYRRWSEVLGGEYEKLARRAPGRRHSVIDEYGATDPAEFFAVATEAFFDSPRRLRSNHRELYEVLARYFGQDPAHWAAA